MAEKWKKRIAGYPVRKVLIGTVAAGLLTILVTVAYVGINFGSQISQVYQERVAMREQWYENQEGEKDAEQDTAAGGIGWDRSRLGRSDSREDGFGGWRSDRYGRTNGWHSRAGGYGMEQGWKSVSGYGTTDYVLFTAVGIIGIILCLLFQLTLIVYAMQLAWRTGMNPLACGLLVLFLRMAGVICLWIYVSFRHKCKSCGKIQKKDAVYCSECGMVLKVKCPECQMIQPVENSYCSGCGKDLQK